MPQVPVYATPQVEERALPGAKQESAASPALLDAGADQAIATGKSMEAFGSGLEKIAFNMAERQDADAVFQAESGDKAAYIAFEAELKANRQGHKAKGAATDTAAWWKSRIDGNLENLTDSQKRLYAKRIVPVQLQSVHGISNFEAGQLEVAHDASWTATKATTTNLAAANPSENVVASSIDEIKRLNAYQGKRKGWDAKTLEAVNMTDTTNLHAQVIQTLANGDQAAAAGEYFEKHKDQIAGSKQAELGKYARTVTASAIGDGVAASVWAKFKPANDTDPIRLSDAEDEIRKDPALKNNPDALKVALDGFEHRARVLEVQRKEFTVAGVANVEKLIIAGKRGAALFATPEWNALVASNPKAANEIRRSIKAEAAADESRAYTAEAREFTRAQRQEQQLNIAGTDAMLQYAMRPEILANVSVNEILALRSTIGTQNTEMLLKRQQDYQKHQAGLSEVKLDSDQFLDFAKRAGLNPASKDKADKDALIMARNKAEAIIGTMQQGKNRVLSREERDAVLQSQIDNVVMQRRWYWKDAAVPAIALPRSAQNDAYVEVGGERVALAAISPTYRQRAIEKITRRNIPVTESLIAEMWLADGKPNDNTKRDASGSIR